MELFYVEATVWNPRGVGRRKRVTLLVDRGATYTVLPAALLAELGVAPTRKVRLRLADNKVVERELVGGDRGGGEGVYLLGSVTMEQMGLTPDPVQKRLRPTEALLM